MLNKNIDALLHAFHIVSKKYNNNIFLYMVGRNININNKELTTTVNNFKI